MKKLMFGMFLAFGMASVIHMTAAFAQDAAVPVAAEDKFSFGKVVSASAEQVVVKEYDFAKDADVEMAYAVTAETELGNVNAVTDLTADDDIVIDYVEKDGKRVITTLVKEEKGVEAPMAGQEGTMPAEGAVAVNADAPAAPAMDAPVQQ